LHWKQGKKNPGGSVPTGSFKKIQFFIIQECGGRRRKMKLLFATGNAGKLAEAQKVLAARGIQVKSLPLSLTEPDAGSVEEVARMKLRQVMERGIDGVMVDDAGIFFAAWPGFPGVLTKRVFDLLGYRGIRKLLAGERREAWFEGCVAVSWQGETKVFCGRTDGRIIEEIYDDLTPVPGFPFDPLFVPVGESTVLRDLPEERRLFHSYRRKALEQLADWLASKK
jgi:XTP/dITP diphosphohydrolase